jgi:hypothetical protein
MWGRRRLSDWSQQARPPANFKLIDHVNATPEMASRFQALPVPRWRYGELYLALLDTLEAALPLAHPSDLSKEAIARRVFAMAERLIGETVRILA